MTPSIGKTLSTTTYSYDANGNLMQTGGWSYMWDYLNRMLAFGLQQLYYYICLRSIRRSRAADLDDFDDILPQQVLLVHVDEDRVANTYATSTNYIWNGDTLLATIDQKLLQRHGNRHADHTLHPSRSFRQHQRCHRCQKGNGRTASGLLSVRWHPHLLQLPTPLMRSGNILGSTLTPGRDSTISTPVITIRSKGSSSLQDPVFLGSSKSLQPPKSECIFIRQRQPDQC